MFPWDSNQISNDWGLKVGLDQVNGATEMQSEIKI